MTTDVTVTPSRPDCSFLSSSKYDWLSVSPTGGSGEAVARVSAEATIEPFRVGSVVIAGKEVNIMQAGPLMAGV